jgi:hypothetical protein
MNERTFPNEVTYPRPINGWEFVPLSVTMSGLSSAAGETEKVSAVRYRVEDESAGVDLSGYLTADVVVPNIFILSALFLPTETDRKAGTYRVAITGRGIFTPTQVETVHLLIKVLP